MKDILKNVLLVPIDFHSRKSMGTKNWSSKYVFSTWKKC